MLLPPLRRVSMKNRAMTRKVLLALFLASPVYVPFFFLPGLCLGKAFSFKTGIEIKEDYESRNHLKVVQRHQHLFCLSGRRILRFRWLLLLLVFILTIFAFYDMRTLKMDTSNESLFFEGDLTKLLLGKFRDTFGNEDFVYVLIETDDFFSADTIRLIKKLAEDLEEHVPYVKDMKFLSNVEYVESGIEISDLIEEILKNLRRWN